MFSPIILIKENQSWLNLIPEWVTAIATLILGGAAIYGVFWEWKKQIKGKTDYEIARRYLKAALKLRDAIKYVRNPFIPVGEMQDALKKNGLDSEEYKDKQKTNIAVYSERWKKVTEAWTNLEAELLDAEVSWGYEARKAQINFDALIRKLFAELHMYLEGYSKKITDNIIYDTGDKDEFSKSIDDAIKEIEEFLKPHLK